MRAGLAWKANKPENGAMAFRWIGVAAGLFSIALAAAAQAKQAALNGPLPDIRQLMQQVQGHQRQLDKVRESYTYTSMQTVQDVDASGQVKKTQVAENEDFFVNGHVIERTVKREGDKAGGEGREDAAGTAAGRADDQCEPAAGHYGCAQRAQDCFSGEAGDCVRFHWAKRCEDAWAG